jgi:PAS domain S-box-containing protein
LLYNDAYRVIAADKHPGALGRSTREIWPEVWHINEPIFNAVLEYGKSVYLEDTLFPIDRHGRREETYFTLCYSPVRGEAATVVGSLVTLIETTGRVREHRSLASARERAEVAASRERETLAALVKSIPDEVWYADTDGKFTLVNSAASREFGLKNGQDVPVDKLAASLEVLRPDGSQRPVEEAPPLRALAGDTVSNQEEMIRTPATGELRWRQVNASPVRDAAGAILGSVSVVRDITDRKHAEQALRRSRQTLAELIERAPFGIYVVDSQFRVAQMNAASQAGAFRNARPVIGRDFDEVMHILWPDAVATEIVGHFRQTLATGEPYHSPRFIEQRHDVPVMESYEWEVHRMVLPDGQPSVVCYYFDSTELRATEAALRESEERFRAIAESLPQLVYELKADGHANYFNRRWNEYTGNEPRTLEDRLELVHPEDRTRVIAAWRQSRDNVVPFECKYRFRRHDGTYRWFLGRAFPVRSSTGEVVRWFGTATDVHELFEAQEALREDQALLRTVIDTIAEPIYVKDAQSRLILVNDATLALVGRPREQVVDHTDRELYEDPALGDAILEHDHQVMASGRVHVFEEDVTTPSGHRIMLNTKAPRRDSNGQVIGLVGIARDITELKQAEAEKARILREVDEQRGRLQAVVDSLPVGLWIADATGKVVLINDSARAIWGGQAPPANNVEEYGAYRIWDSASGRPIAPEDLPMARALRGEVFRDVVVDFERFDGSRGTQMVAASPVKTPDGRSSGAVAVVQDITERRRMEAALLEADRRKNEFLAVLSHELRNPLAPIVNSLYILDHAPPGGEQADRAKQVISRQVAHLSNLVNDLLDVTRITRNKIQLQAERLDLNELVRRTVEDNRSFFEEAQVRLELTPAPQVLPVMADRTRIAQIIGNLLQNAAKFTPGGGTTRVTLAAESNLAVLRVSDDGVGMSAETLAGLFQPFMQADHTLERSKGGLGLGLALVKGLVELHGGRISASSEGLGKGSDLVVHLPLAGAVASDQPAAAADRSGGRRRILIIEDNRDAANSLRDALALGHHEVIIAHDGPDGLAKARAFAPEVVVCDIGLPGMDGFEVARAFRADERLRGTFLVALSGYALPEDLARASEAGFERHLAKPPSIEALEQLLADLGDRRR